MSKVTIQGDASGTGIFTIASPNSNTDRTLVLPDETGTVLTTATPGVPVNGPAFHAYMSNTQSVSAATFTNIAFDQEVFDTASCFNNTSSTVGGIPAHAFLPNVAGYYQVNTAVYNQVSNQLSILRLYKTGAYHLELSRLALTSPPTLNGVGLVYLNGTTDYIQVHFYCSSATTVGNNDGKLVWFQAALVRAA